MNEDIVKLQKRFVDLANAAVMKNVFTFTDFLSLSEADVLKSLKYSEYPELKGHSFYGGYEDAERVMARFGSEEDFGYSMDFPMVCIEITPLNKKFSDDLGHRDYLGALLNLGIDRAVTGDIVIGKGVAYVFVKDSIAEFVTKELNRIKHTTVVAKVTEDFTNFPKKEPLVVNIQVASIRIDGVISKVLNISRNACLELFRTGKVFVNGRECTSNSKSLVSGDTVNVRGSGKFIISDDIRETKKGKINIVIYKY